MGCFDEFDKDHDGYLDKKEASQLMNEVFDKKGGTLTSSQI